jgi:hypothetical protein
MGGIGVGNAIAAAVIEDEGVGEEPYACVYNSVGTSQNRSKPLRII